MKRNILSAAMALVMLAGCGRAPEAPVRRAEVEVVKAPRDVASAQDAGTASVAVVQAEAPPPRVEPPIGLSHEHPKAVDHLARARELSEANDLKGALVECRRAVFDDPTSTSRLEATARMARRVGDKTLARAAYLALAELSPGDALPMLKVARLAITDGDSFGASEAANEAILRDPGLAEGFHLRGRAALQVGKLSEAIRDFKKASTIDPDHAYALNNLGYAWLLAGKPEIAIAPLERAAALLPKLAWVQNNLGIAYEKSGQQEEARAAYSRALELNPRYVKAIVNKSRVNQLAALGSTMNDASPAVEPVNEDELKIPSEPSIAAPPALELKTRFPDDLKNAVDRAPETPVEVRPSEPPVPEESVKGPGDDVSGVDTRIEDQGDGDVEPIGAVGAVEDPEAGARASDGAGAGE